MRVNTDQLNKLQSALEQKVKGHTPGNNFKRLMTLDHVDRRLYGIYLVETFHYTKHNTKNQAMVAMREEKLDINYVKYCLNHALEEAGHEYMALSDLNSMGSKFSEEQLPSPLPATEALIGYLYRLAQHGNPYARLGYSYWAESVYSFNGSGTKLFQQALNLKDSQMTFLVAHAKIDAEHFEEVKTALSRFVKDERSWQAVEEAMLQTLTMTTSILDQVIGEYLKMVDGIPTRYEFLESLKDSTI